MKTHVIVWEEQRSRSDRALVPLQFVFLDSNIFLMSTATFSRFELVFVG